MLNKNTQITKIYYRPTWTCGRFDLASKSAIYFNLITGMSYFFEDHSAVIIGKLLTTPRNCKISIENLVLETGIDESSLSPFLCELHQCGLLSKEHITPEIVNHYKKQIRSTNNLNKTNSIQENKSLITSSAERAYANRCKSTVITVMIELTYRCSERCIHCYNPGAARSHNEISYRNTSDSLSMNDYKRIIDELYDEGVVRVCLSGGDPFSNPLAWDIIEYLYNKEIATEIFTNAQGLSGHEKRLASFFPCDVGISLYSDKDYVHDSITQTKGSFRKSLMVLEQLYELCVPLVIKCCVMRQNINTYFGVSKIADKYSAAFQLECSIFDSMDGDICVSQYLRLTQEQMELVLCDKNNPLYIGKDIKDFGKKMPDLNDRGCGAGYQNFCITPNGNVIPCCSFHAFIGNLKKQHLAEILINNPALKWWNNLKLRDYEECGKHEYCGFCKLCPGLNFAQHGTPLKAAENNCYTAKIRYNLAMRISQGYDPLQGKNFEEIIATIPQEASMEIKKISKDNHYDEKLI